MNKNARIDIFEQRLVPVAGGVVTLSDDWATTSLDTNGWFNSGSTSGGTVIAYSGNSSNQGYFQEFVTYLPEDGVYYNLFFNADIFAGAVEVRIANSTGNTTTISDTISSSGEVNLTFLAGSGQTLPNSIFFIAKNQPAFTPFSGHVTDIRISRNLDASPIGTREEYDYFKSIELEQSVDIPLNYSINSVADFSERNSNFSKSILVPSTQNNDDVFSSLWDINGDYTLNNFNPKRKFRAVVYSSDLPVFDGFLQLQETVEEDGVVDYNVRLFSDSRNFFELMGDQFLSDLNWSELNHKFTWNKLQQVWTGNTTYNSGYYYPLLHNSSEEYFINNFYPATYLRYALDKIASQLGFQLNFNSDLEAVIDRLIIPFEGERLTVNDSEKRNVSVFAGKNSDETGLALIPQSSVVGINYLPIEATDNTISWNDVATPFFEGDGLDGDGDGVLEFNGSIYQYEAQLSGEHLIETVISGAVSFASSVGAGEEFIANGNANNNFSSPLGAVKFDILVNGISVSESNEINTNSTPYLVDQGGDLFLPLGNLSANNNQPFVISASTSLELQAGDTVSIRLYNRFNRKFTRDFPTVDFTPIYPQVSLTAYDDGSYFKVLCGDVPVGEGSIVQYSKWLPKIKLRELWSNLIKMFNLYLWTNQANPNQINIASRNQFYENGEVLDWGSLLAQNEPKKLEFFRDLTDRAITLTYSDSDDRFNNLFKKKNNGKIFGSYTREFDSDFVDQSTDYQVDFVPTPITRNFYGDVVPAIDAELPDEGLRILFLQEIPQSTLAPVLRNDPNSTELQASELVQYYPALHSDKLSSPTLDLNFGEVGAGVMISPVELSKNTLYQSYWKSTLDLIDRGQILTCYMKLTEREIQRVKNDLSVKIWLGDSYYLISQIFDYNANFRELTKVELIKLEGISKELYNFIGVANTETQETDFPDDTNTNLVDDGYSVNSILDGEIIRNHNLNKNSSSTAQVFGRNNKVFRNVTGLIVGNRNQVAEGVSNFITAGSGNMIEAGAKNVFLFGVNDKTISASSYVNIGDKIILENDSLRIEGAIERNILVIDDAYTATTANDIIFASATSKNVLITLPENLSSREFIIKRVNSPSYKVNVYPYSATTASTTIEGAGIYELSNNETIRVVSDGANYWLI